jgi:hypothetical protein
MLRKRKKESDLRRRAKGVVHNSPIASRKERRKKKREKKRNLN